MNTRTLLNNGLKLAAIGLAVGINVSADAVVWPNVPAAASAVSAPPMTMLVATKDHKLFYEAYNDATDLDGDGALDTRFKPTITYFGLFDSTYCYTYSSSANRFEPAALSDALGRCLDDSTPWSGNWLNYMTTSRIDALRKVLYGGAREVDTTSDTVLRRAYIPQDAHSWGKEYHSPAVDGYNIENFTPLLRPTQPTTGPANVRHFFGNLTANVGTSCATLDTCSNLPPLLRMRQNVGQDRRVWEWASKERPVLNNALSTGGFPAGTGAEENFQVRVQVCTAAFNNGCRQYPNGGSPIYKPVGLLHDYGANGSMLFGLMTGSYDRHMSGGRLRKAVSSFADEVNSTTGQFTTTARIVNTFNRLRIRGYNQFGGGGTYGTDPFGTTNGGGATPAIEGRFVDWGNPVGEMLYEATRYFAGRGAPTAAFMGSTTLDEQVGLSSATWDDPYSSTSAANAAQCSRPSFLTISDINPSFDSDSVPGSFFNNFTGDLTGLNVVTRAGNITSIESNITGMRFIGQSGTAFDFAPTAKQVDNLGTIRGLAPDEPAKQGSYYSAAVAYHAKTTDLRTDLAGRQSVDNYVVALSSPLPKIEVPMANGRVINLVPFAKTVNGPNGVTQGAYQPTNQIVDFYVESIANAGTGTFNASVNGGRYEAIFNINFEDVEQGGDHDMDAIARYVVRANANNTLSVQVVPTYEAGGFMHHMGYVISGTDRDGVYLVARDQGNTPAYFLNVPAGRSAGYCSGTVMPADCNQLPTIGSNTVTFTFSPGTAGTSASLLQGPLWYAAKYGGFTDRNNNNRPDLPLEWDANTDGVPDSYFLVQNPLTLRAALVRAFDEILERSGSGGNVIANSTSVNADSLVYQATFDSRNWSGEVLAYPVDRTAGVGTIASWRASENIPVNRRIIFSADDGTGELFQWANLSTAERTLLGSSSVLDYLRGSRSNEIRNGGAFRNRDETNVLGDIAHSSPAYLRDARDNRTIFIGSNDGMLHAFDAVSGVEQFAFIPRSSMPRLASLTNPAYNERHQYYVDGDIVVSSSTQTGSVNYLVSTLGRGGKGLFGLDVSSPSTFGGTDVLWEYDATAALAQTVPDLDLGYMLGRPIVARLQKRHMGGHCWQWLQQHQRSSRAVCFQLGDRGTDQETRHRCWWRQWLGHTWRAIRQRRQGRECVRR
jgi:type IV pilus assembly protein PilY1